MLISKLKMSIFSIHFIIKHNLQLHQLCHARKIINLKNNLASNAYYETRL
jgi:hypothetical protein